MYMKDGLHLSGKGVAVFADKLSAAVDSGMGTITNIFGTDKPITNHPENISQQVIDACV